MLYHHFSIFETANKTGDDEFTVCHFCRRLGSRTVDWRRVYAERDLALVVRESHRIASYVRRYAQAVFQIELMKALRQLAPGINPLVVLSAGANSEAISSFPRASQGGIVQGYSSALQSTFAIGIPFAGVALLVSFFMPWFRYYDASQKPTAETALTQSEKGDVMEGGKGGWCS